MIDAASARQQTEKKHKNLFSKVSVDSIALSSNFA